MKRIAGLVFSLFLGLNCLNSTAFCGEVTLFGPQQYQRTKGAPNLYSDVFSGVPGEGQITITNGNDDGGKKVKHAVSSARVSVNGVEIFLPKDFNKRTYTLASPINLGEQNTLSVELRSTPGSYITVTITADLPAPTVLLSAVPTTISAGESSALSWQVIDADSVSIDQGIGSVDVHGTVSVSPSVTSTYTLTAIGHGGTTTAGALVTYVNTAPVATNDQATTDEKIPVTTANVLVNDTDIDGDTIKVSEYSQAANGKVISHGDGTFTYTPHNGFSGTDSFSYTVSDGKGGSDTGAVTIQVIPGFISLAITSPVPGQQFYTDIIAVRGTVNRPGASVFVNGIAATVNGDEYTAENVPLIPGTNTIGVLAEDGEDTDVASIIVMRMATLDLEPIQIVTTSSIDNDGSAKVSGQAMVTLANHGSSNVATPYRIVLFEDANASGSYEKTQDNRLGEEAVAAGLGAGETTAIAIDFSGQLLFRDNRLHVFVDSSGDVEESDEANNITATYAGGTDLSASLLKLDDAACPDGVTLSVRMGNAGDASLPSGVSVTFYDGDPENGGTQIGTALTSHVLEPGQYEDLKILWQDPPAGMTFIYARADDDGAGVENLSETDEENNQVFSEMLICTSPPVPVNGVAGQVVDAVTGNFFPGATVLLYEEENGNLGPIVDQTATDEYGGFTFSEIEPGMYVMTADLQGFLTGNQRFVLSPGETLSHQDVVLSPLLGPEEIRIVLTWGEHPADLEAHLTAPNPEGCRHHCFYWNPTIPGANLDMDNKSSYGPETLTISRRGEGTYRFYVHDFTNRNSRDSTALSNSGATVTVYSGSGDAPTIYNVPSGAGTVWHVFNLDGRTGQIKPVEKMTHQDHPGRIDFPTITSSPNADATYGKMYIYQIKAEDPDQDTLIYNLVKGPEGMQLDPLSGLIQWTPTTGQEQWQDVEVRVNDGRCGEDTQKFRINVTYLPVVQLDIEPCSGMNPGGDITLTWQTERTDSVVIDQDIGEVPANGSVSIPSPDQPIPFTLTAINGAGQVQHTVPNYLSIKKFNASCVSSSGETTFFWDSECAVSCEIDQGIGRVPASGSIEIPSSIFPQDYTLTCTNGADVTLKRFRTTQCPSAFAEITESAGCGWSTGDPVTLNWTTTGAENCSIVPDVGNVPLNGSIEVWPSEDPSRYTLLCTGASATVMINNPQSVALAATAYSLLPGESTTLYWDTKCFETCSVDQEIGDVATTGSLTVTPTQLPTTYTLTATGAHDTLTKSVTIRLLEPAVSFDASPVLIKKGEATTLTWRTDRADACSIQPDIGEVPLSGSITVSPDQNTIYNLTAVGMGGTSVRTVTVTYERPAVAIHADREYLDTAGDAVTLTWVFSNADTCEIDQGIGEVPLGGSIVVNPQQTTTYTITAKGPGGIVKDSVTVAYPAPTVEIEAHPGSIIEGQPVTLSWLADHSATHVIEPDIGPVTSNGTIDVRPSITQTYTITASGRGGTASAQTTVTVVNPPSITLIKPDGGQDHANDEYTIKWIDGDHDSDAVISLYYDINNSGADGTLITSGISENVDGQYDQYLWNTTGIPAGTYFVYAVIEDGINDPVVDYSDGVVTIDHSVTDEIKLVASDGAAYDYFGRAVSISGGYAAVGAPSTDEGGAVYIFNQEGTAWVEQVKLTAGDGTPFDHFGESVSISGDTVVVGAPNGNENNGAVYVFKREGSTWTEQARLTASDGQAWDHFGTSISISGDTLVVGAPSANDDAGAAYVFTRAGASWVELKKLTAGDGAVDGYFGTSASISGDRLVVGSPSADNQTGAAFIFRRVGSDWIKEARLAPGDAVRWGRFGNAVSISGSYVIVGNIGMWEAMVEGAVYIFMHDGSGWIEQEKISDANVNASESFGHCVSINGDMAAVGEPNVQNHAGTVYLFKRIGSQWIQQDTPPPNDGEGEAQIPAEQDGEVSPPSGDEGGEQPGDSAGPSAVHKLIPSDGEDGDFFGGSVALGADHIIVGSISDDDNGHQSGSAYIVPFFSVSISADLASIRLGGEGDTFSTLSWTSRDAEILRIDPDIGAVAASGSLRIYPQQTTTYTLTGTRYGATLTDNITVTVIDPSVVPTVTIAATPETIVCGNATTLSWSSTNVETVTLDNGIGQAPMTGSLVVSPAQATTYTVTAANAVGAATASVTVTVADPLPTVKLSAEPVDILVEEIATLAWTTTHADSVSIDPGIGHVEPNGTISVSPMQTTDYTIRASGPGGNATSAVTVRVNIPEPTVSLWATPLEIVRGESATLNWTTTNADTVAIDRGIGDVQSTGSIVVFPGTDTIYTITATGPGGTSTQPVTVTVISPISIQILSPEKGGWIDRPDVMVRGTFVNTTGSETGITVNGMVAMVYGDQFVVNHVALQDGENTIAVTATDANGHMLTKSISVFTGLPEHHIELVANIESGGSPLETSLHINGTFSIVESAISSSGPGPVEFLERGHDEYRIDFIDEGVYYLTAEVVHESITYTDTIAIVVMDAVEIDALLQQKWADMKAALISGNVELALQYHHERSHERYSAIYNAIGSDLATLVSQMQDISLIYCIDGTAKYRIRQNHETDGQDVTITYYVYFTRDDDGLWRIEKY